MVLSSNTSRLVEKQTLSRTKHVIMAGAGFSDAQMKQLQGLLQPLQTLYGKVEAMDKDIGNIWESTLRKGIIAQYGKSFAKEYSIDSLQHVAKLVCKSGGWSEGSDPLGVCEVASKLAKRLLEAEEAAKLLRALWDQLCAAAPAGGTFRTFCKTVTCGEGSWFMDGELQVRALGRSLALAEGKLKGKLEKLHKLLEMEESESK